MSEAEESSPNPNNPPLKRHYDSEPSSEEAELSPQSPKISRMACNQTAVAQLQELCMKRKWSPPLYEERDVSGPSNDPTFEMSVTLCNGIKGIGRGKQKRAAKHDAAQKALVQLQERALPDSNSSPVPVQPAAINPYQEVGGNPVGELQNLCSQKRLPPPEYTTIGDEGEPHEKIYTIKCTVMQRTATGRARKKQVAKHLSAQNMLQLLNSSLRQILDDIPNDPAVSTTFSQKLKKEASVSESDMKKDIEIVERYKELRDDIPSAPTISPGTKFVDYHLAYAAQLGDLGEILDKSDVKEERDKMRKLEMVADSLNFKVSVTDDIGKDKWHIVFVQVDTNPPTIQAGHHTNRTEALQEAADKTLEFLKIMAKC